jgi:hypothetical protein
MEEDHEKSKQSAGPKRRPLREHLSRSAPDLAR